MGFASSLKKLVGGGKDDDAPLVKYTPPARPAATLQPSNAATPAPQSSVRIQREEILGEKGKLSGYRVAAVVSESGQTTLWNASDLGTLLADDSLMRIAQSRAVLIPVVPSVLSVEILQPHANPNLVFVADSSRMAGSEPDELRAWMSRLRAAGITVGIEGPAEDAAMTALDRCVDWYLVDLHAGSMLHAEQFAKARDGGTAAFAVRGVASWAERDALRSFGYHYFLGDFLTDDKPAEESKTIDAGRLRIMDVLNKLRASEDLTPVVASLKLDPGLIVRLLALVNSPGAGLVQKVTSIEQAVIVLGRDRLYRWCTALLFSAGKGGKADQALLEKALARGRFMELAGEDMLSKKQCDELFLSGVLTFLEPLLGMSMARILDKLVVADDVKRMLLHNDGPYGVYLMLAIASERGQAIEALAERVGASAENLHQRNIAATAWAVEAMQSS